MNPTIKQSNAGMGQFDGCENYLVALSNSAVSIKKPGGTSDTDKHRTLYIFNDTGAVAYVGGENVTASGATKGHPVDDQAYYPFPKTLGIDEEFYAVLASGTGNLIVVAEYHGSQE
jgi:hypothetical protein